MKALEPQKRDVIETVRRYHQRTIADSRHRYRSWDHCFCYFQTLEERSSPEARRIGALHLAFFLASWGMYRGSSFLLRQDYTVHEPTVAHLLSPACTALRSLHNGAAADASALIDDILSSCACIRQAYEPFGNATDTLVTKILLGTTAALPACDRYFIAGFKAAGFPFSRVNSAFVEKLLELSRLSAFHGTRNDLHKLNGTSYPVMKVVDMYYWQKGYEYSG